MVFAWVVTVVARFGEFPCLISLYPFIRMKLT